MNLYSYAKVSRKPRGRLRKIIMVMKLIFFIITIACVQVSAIGYAQNVSMNQKDVMLTKVFSNIENQTGYSFFWKNADLTKIKIDVKLQNVSLEEALKEIFDGLPFTYSISKKSIVVQAKAPSLLDKITEVFKDTDVRGVVSDAKGEPLPGATVAVKDGKARTITNARGEFILKNVADDAIIQVSFMGYVTKEVPVGNRLLGIRLELSNSKLDEIQVMAYGKTSRRFSTGNITTVTAEEIAKQPVMNPLLALVGKVPGMTVTPNTGYASGTIKVEIRGRSTLSSNYPSDPLYIIDGVPLTYLDISGNSSYEAGSPGIIQNGSYTAGWGQSPLFNINPANISSIEVLKDADATAIYGSRGANGVILITTKKGKPGTGGISANVSQGVNVVTRYWDLLNTKDYVKMRKEAFKNDGITPTLLNAPDLIAWDTTRYTNWQKELWGNTGKITRVNLSIAGGNENTQFSISPGFGKTTDIMTNSGSDRSANLAFSITNSAFNKKLKTSFQGAYTFTDVNTNSTPSVATLAPNAPPIFDNIGQLNFKEWNEAGLPDSYPFGSLNALTYSKTSLMFGSLNIGYELFNGLQLSSLFGYNMSHNTAGGTSPISSQNPVNNPTGGMMVGTNDNQNWNIEPQLNYERAIAKGNLSVFLGATFSGSVASGQNTMGFGYEDDNLLGSIALAPFKMINDTYGQYKYAAVSGRISYKWDNKYFVNLSGRRDGSSRFGPGKRYGNFGALGVAWIASEESWVKNVLPSFMGFVKFRGSYGLTGSDGVGDYQYISQWSSQPGGTPLYPYGGITPLVSLHAVNPDYRWQVNKKLELAAEMGLFRDRITLNMMYYRNRCGNQLTSYPTPLYTGFGGVTANWPATVENSGWEFVLSSTLIAKPDFNWDLSLNGGSNKNILQNYPDLELSPYATQYVIGKSVNDKYLLHYIGIDPMTGQYAFEDRNGDGVINSNPTGKPGQGYDDRYIVINSDPKFSGSMENRFRYKNITLSFSLYYKNQMGVSAFHAGMPAGNVGNIPVEIFENRWQQPGQQAKYAALTTTSGGMNGLVTGSDLYYTDASYLRLQNVSFYYIVPDKVLKNKQLSFSLNAQNLWVFTKYKGIDPDTQNFMSMPSPKIITAGLNLSF
uniref:SusC/RagA family TonB-linked outer membrane protein n=1 Tax=Pedobacter schmidteae TaxID=2201271 RepID=UPI000EAC4FF1|nr:SusC/RagA family TonB-linked outer membrane protein [Pedobacter schmidteae]